MSKAGEERFVFETEWYDTQASLIRKYLFTFFPGDSTIEMVSHHSLLKPSFATSHQSSLIVTMNVYSTT